MELWKTVLFYFDYTGKLLRRTAVNTSTKWIDITFLETVCICLLLAILKNDKKIVNNPVKIVFYVFVSIRFDYHLNYFVKVIGKHCLYKNSYLQNEKYML